MRQPLVIYGSYGTTLPNYTTNNQVVQLQEPLLRPTKRNKEKMKIKIEILAFLFFQF